MIRHAHWWLFVLALGVFPACGSSDSDQDPDGNGDGEDVTPGDPDDPDNVEDGSLALGDRCDKDDSCNSGLCVKIGSGINEGLCSKRCEEADDCDTERWTCRDIIAGSGDEIRGCAPQTLCIDNDGDGYGIGPECLGSDCDDDDPSVYQGAPEICDGKDNSCDGKVDNSPIDVGQACNTNLEGVCADGMTECHDGVLECVQLQMPSQEICDGLDNDCDGLVDEGVQEDENDNYINELGRACAPDGSTCQNGLYVCDPVERGGLYCDGLGEDAEEICDGIDNNCNGQIDEGIEGLGDVCEVGEGLCVNASAKVCDPDDPHAPPICDVEPKWENQEEETCDYIDNDCDGVVDNGFINEDGVYHTLEHCGGCDVDCNVQWGAEGDPSAVHAVPTCDVSGNSAQCGFDCTDGYVDMDGVVDNGCELLPDDDAIYVSTPAKGGADGSSCGSYDAPCATITQGISRAKSEGRSNVRISDGVFREGIVLENGINVLGGHSSVNWQHDTTVNSTVIYGASDAFSDDSVAVVARGITKKTELSGLTITAQDAPESGNSIALFVEDSNDNFIAKDNTLQAGFGGSGTSGAKGSDGSTGSGGSKGSEGNHVTSCTQSDWLQGANGGSTTCDGTSTAGGKGGGSSCPEHNKDYDASLKANSGQNNSGDKGTPGKSAQSAMYNNGTCLIASGGAENNNGTDGVEGRDGSNGSGGQGASSGAGSLLSNKMWRGTQGSAGEDGTHGGGGGGGGASRGLAWPDGTPFGIAPTGGGGGAGGCGGKSAQGGHAGGGSFALYIVGSSSNTPTIKNNTLARGVGGVGGAGGLGGSGGTGGAGGHGGNATYGSSATGNGCAKTGRRGGDGGRGGQGGGGGGGAGGNAYDLATHGLSSSAQSALLSDNNFMLDENEDTAGSGGQGGPSIGNDGADGSSGTSGRSVNLP